MLRQYVLERRQGGWIHEPTERETLSHWKRKPRRYDDDVQCGIFWDIENVSVKHEYLPAVRNSWVLTLSNFHPPAVAIEAIRDFAESVHTPVFQAYMTRYATPTERRVHAIYAQLGVSFIQCPDLGKDTADKKIISDMWKFYADKSQSKSRIRIVLITGDRDFADAIGQLRNVGVEIGILTGNSTTTAPVYDDYTIGMRVLPLLGVISARADEGYAYVHQGPNGKYLSRMRDKQEEDYQALLEETDAEREGNGIWTTTTPTISTKDSHSVNGSKPLPEAKTSTTAVDPIKTEKMSQSPTTILDAELNQTDATLLKSSDVEPTDIPISETKSPETKSLEIKSKEIKLSAPASDELHSNLSSSSRPDGPGPGTKSPDTTKYIAEERKVFAQEREPRQREEHDREREALEAKERETHSKTVLGRLGNAFSSWLLPKPAVENKDDVLESRDESSRISEGRSMEQSVDKGSKSPASKTMPLPTVYREDEKFPRAQSRDRVATKSTPIVPTSSNSASTQPTTATPPETVATINKPASSATVNSETPSEQIKFDLEPLTSQQLTTHIRTTPQISPIHFAISPPTSTRPLTPHQPHLHTSIYSASSLLLPGTPSLFPQPPTPTSYLVRCAITALSSSPSLPRNPDALAAYYEEEIVKNLPVGVSAEEMRRLFVAWVGIERRSADGLSEESVRRAMRMSLVKAEEIVEARKHEREKKGEEERARKEVREAVRERERDVVLGMLGGKKVCPLTEPTTATQSTLSSLTTQIPASETTEVKETAEPTSAAHKSNSKSAHPNPVTQTTETKKTTISTNTTISPKTTSSQTWESKQAIESAPSESAAHKLSSDSSEAPLSKPSSESKQTSESTKTAELTREASLAEKSDPKSATQTESTRTASSGEKSISKNAKRKAASGVAVKAQAILEKRKSSVERGEESEMEAKAIVGKSEVAKPEEKSEAGNIAEKQMDIIGANVTSDASQPEEIKESKGINGKRESSKADESTADAKPTSQKAAGSKLEKRAAAEPVAERRERHSMPTNTTGKHTVASHTGPIHPPITDVKTSSTKGIGERKSDTSPTNPTPAKTKQPKHNRNVSLLERVLGITSTPSSESPVKRFIDIATETFEKNLKRLGGSSQDGQDKTTSVYGLDEEDDVLKPRDESATNAPMTSNVASKNDSASPTTCTNLPSQKAKSVGLKESQISERQNMLKM
jgi:hypothetical protein